MVLLGVDGSKLDWASWSLEGGLFLDEGAM